MQPRTKTSVGMETADQTVARAKKLVGAPTPSTSTPTTPTNLATGAITPESLTPQPTINIPTPPAPTGQDKLMADIGVQAEDIFTQQQTAARTAAEQTKGTALDTYLASLQASKGLTGLTAEEYAKEGGVDDITPELNAINDQIRREQRSLDLAKRAITEKGGGLKVGAASEISNLERESFQKQADLSIIQLAVQGRYDSAKEVADRAVAARLEQQNIFNETLKFAYNEAKETFTTAEQREFETLLGNRERALTAQKENLDAIYELGLQASADGAPTSVVERMMKAKTREEALAIGGGYIGQLERESKRADIAQGWANLDLRQQEVNLSRERLNAELNSTGNQYGTLDGKPQNATQGLVNGYANRMLEADKVIGTVGDLFTGRASAIGALLPSMLQGPERQQFEQAKRNYINSVLRRESGAVISPEEFKNADKQYFPQPGDSAEVLQQKANNRNTVINNFYSEANVPRPTFAGDIIESDGKRYRVESDGVTITEIP